MDLLIIDDVDFTDYILSQNYEVNNNPVYIKWTDANFTDHREKARDKVIGEIGFYLPDDGGVVYKLLKDCLAKKMNTTTLATTVTVYVSNEDTMREIDAFCDLTPNIERVTDNGILYDEFTLKIEER